MFHYHKSSGDSKVQSEMKESRKYYCDGRDEYAAGEYERAYALFDRAVQMQEILFGKYHQDTVKSYWWLGKSACQTHLEPQEALKAFQRATRTGEIALGKILYLDMLRDIEECLAVTGWSKSLSFKKSKSDSTCSLAESRASVTSRKSTKSLSSNFRKSIRSKKKLMKVLQEIIFNEQEGDRAFKNGRYTKANDFYGKALALQDVTVGSDSLDGADIRCKLAYSMLKDSGTEVEAEKTLKLAYECYVDKVGKDHPATYGVAAKIKTIVTWVQGIEFIM